MTKKKECLNAAANAVVVLAPAAKLFNPLTMSAPLVKTHHALDKAADRCYGMTFKSDRERGEHLFAMYKRLVVPMMSAPKGKRRGKGNS